MRLGIATGKWPDTCEIHGCGEGPSDFLLSKNDDVRMVCRRCAQEMMAIGGWAFISVRNTVLLDLPWVRRSSSG